MEFFIETMRMIIETYRTDFTLYGFTFSLWDVILLAFVCGAVTMFLSRLFK